MPQKPKRKSVETIPYRHENETRTNNPPVGIAAGGDIHQMQKTKYYYNPHLQPVLRFDDRNDNSPPDTQRIIIKSQKQPLTPDEAQQLTDALQAQPWLEWANKREEGDAFTVEPVSLFIHERISAQAIVETAKRNNIQTNLFAEPQQKYRDAIQFYQHDVPWANRLILGDSLVVMDSLAHREGLAGQVQMVYVDPPYGISFRSNFQPDAFDKSVTDSDKDLTREMGQIKAYRDTWKLGVHSYLSYLRQRLVVARELLKDSGSIFVQIGNQNVHRVRCLLDEIFGSENFVGEIIFKTRSTSTKKTLSLLNDYIIWYSKERASLKFRRLYEEKGAERFELADINGEIFRRKDAENLSEKSAKYFSSRSLYSMSGSETSRMPFKFRGKEYTPAPSRGWICRAKGLSRLASAERIFKQGNSIRYKYFHSDFEFVEIGNLWQEQMSEQNKSYVVQTAVKPIERCMLMTTEPGDIVLDPTCGSGTTAYVAEKWGRRWIGIDTSRIAVTLARTRLLTAHFDYYRVQDESEGIGSGLVLKTAPRIQLKDIAHNVALDAIFAKHEPVLAEKLGTLNAALKEVTPALRKELKMKLGNKKQRDVTDADRRRWELPKTAWKAWEVPFDTDAAWPEALQAALRSYREAWRAKMDEVNACIDESAEYEVLVEQPVIDRSRLRVSGPFTVESVQPLAESLDGESPEVAVDREPANAAAYLDRMYSHLKTGGVDFENEKRKFARLDRIVDAGFFHAEGQFEDDKREIGVMFGPQHGPVTAFQVERCLREARRHYDVLLFAGFHFEAEASEILQGQHPRLQTHLIQISPDVEMGALLKQTQGDKLFTVIGAPRTVLESTDTGEWRVEMEGVDTYNPVDNTIEQTKAAHVAAWFLDADYDGRTFCPTQAFFPNKNAWKNIAKSLKTVVDSENFAAFSGTTSLPFRAGEHHRIAVKVIDRHGNELMKIHDLENAEN